ncbi:MAG: hypothetical protein FJZ43_03130, partial [Candidatus Staskawiczbacteria bacterium]|nr:hypothetical protein [Candidatus Staskawiczbacteria bacterium]
DKVKGKIIELQGDISSIDEIPVHIREIYKTSFSVSPYAFIEVAARAQKWVDQALSRNMYLEDRDIEKTMDIYTTAWRKGLKSTYYLHMKPRHGAEQSTVAVNKSAQMGKTGFASAFKKTESIVIETSQNIASVETQETIIEKITDVLDRKPLVEPVQQISKQIFSNVQTQISLPQNSNIKMQNENTNLKIETQKTEQKVEPVISQKLNNHYQEKVIDGKLYKVHMPSDPQENFTCDGCQ